MRSNRLVRRLPSATTALAAVAATCALGAAAAGAASTPPAGGSFRVFGTSSGLGGGGKVVLTGAIGDRGTTRSVNKAGKPSANGNYVKLSLTQGTILVNATTLNAAANRAFGTVKVNSATCSTSVVASATLPLVSGTGHYAGIGGAVRITISVGFILPRYTSGARAGQCNESNSAQPTGSLQIVSGTGTVRF
jgi:hypothetical protein